MLSFILLITSKPMAKQNTTKNIFYIYMIECGNGAYYTGYTTDIKRRYREHCKGSYKCKYTRSFPPVRLAACWEVSDLSSALKLENIIKRLPRAKKILAVNEPSFLQTIISETGIICVNMKVNKIS